jgi:hypothetical protein
VRSGLIALALTATVSGAGATPLVIDQANLVTPTGFTSTNYIWGQQFTPTLGLLGQIDVWLFHDALVHLDVYDGKLDSGNLLGTSDVVHVSEGGLYSFTFDTPIAMNAGAIAAFRIRGQDDQFVYLGVAGPTYTGGSAGSGDYVDDPTGFDLVFATYGYAGTPAEPTPEPGSLLLVVTGIMVGARRWRRRRGV